MNLQHSLVRGAVSGASPTGLAGTNGEEREPWGLGTSDPVQRHSYFLSEKRPRGEVVGCGEVSGEIWNEGLDGLHIIPSFSYYLTPSRSHLTISPTVF